ncbi:MAG: hypothetical protein ACRC5C_10865, partial [Bacilli bacterium]
MSTNLLILGARAPVALHFARMFARAGDRVWTADSVPIDLGRWSRYVQAGNTLPAPNKQFEAWTDEIVRMVRRHRITVILPTCEEVFWLSRAKTKIEALTGATVFCESLDVLTTFHRKDAFIAYCADKGLRVPLTVSEKPKQGGDWVVKPIFSRFATEVKFITPSTFEHANFDPARYIWQERLVGPQRCSYSVVQNGHVVQHVEYRSDVTLEGSTTILFEQEPTHCVLDAVQQLFRGTTFSGQFAFDWIHTSEGCVPIECNP